MKIDLIPQLQRTTWALVSVLAEKNSLFMPDRSPSPLILQSPALIAGLCLCPNAKSVQSFAVGRLPSKADDMCVSLRAILLCNIASLHSRTAGRLA